ncbi:MAG: NADH-quinone oxidoreductase subunit N [Acidobacteriia bacterium]|nr:NADH-quinone oxidoreductase subunit N [Terriglobia bacterium]
MFPPREEFLRVLPILIFCGGGTLLMLLQPFLRSRTAFSLLALAGSLTAVVSVGCSAAHPGAAFYGLIGSDPASVFFEFLVGAVAFLVILGSASYLERESLAPAEFYALIFFAAAGMCVLASAREMLTAFIGLEMSSISSYILAGYRRESPKAAESALKYFLLGSFATAFFLYGIALLYGSTGTTVIAQMTPLAPGLLPKLGLALLLIGLSFKVAAAPFQLWTPDVYEGAPTPVTALFSAGPKAATFALLLRIFVEMPLAAGEWTRIFWILAVITMFAGNLGALLQTNVKRILAYSSIAHAGYILVAFAASNEIGVAAVLFYLLAYAAAKLGAFSVVAHLGGAGEKRIELDDFAGLAQRQPIAAAAFSLFLLSLLGIPVTAGFFGKFYIFKAALASHLIGLAVLLGVNSVIAAYYYLRLIIVMYMREPKEETAALPFPGAVTTVLALCALATVYFGLFPNHIIAFASNPRLFGH